jgi:hypothetical protein
MGCEKPFIVLYNKVGLKSIGFYKDNLAYSLCYFDGYIYVCIDVPISVPKKQMVKYLIKKYKGKQLMKCSGYYTVGEKILTMPDELEWEIIKETMK